MNAEVVFGGGQRRLRARGRFIASGLAATLVIAFSAFLSVQPLLSGGRENRRIGLDNSAIQEFSDLRTTLAGWQFWVEPQFARLSASASIIPPAEIATGAQLLTSIQAGIPVAVQTARANGLPTVARDLESTNVAFTKTTSDLGTLIAGAPAKVIAAGVSAERAAFGRLWNLATNTAYQLPRTAAADLRVSGGHLETGRKTVLTVDAVLAFLTLAGAAWFGQRARRKQRVVAVDRQRRAFEAVLQDGLEMSEAESDVYAVVGKGLAASVPGLHAEVLIADSSRAHFHRVADAPGDTGERDGCGVVSPLECPATVRGHTLLFPTSRALNACPHLAGRASGDCSAVCIPIGIGGRAVGVTHATGLDGFAPTEDEVRLLEITSRRASERVAMLRAFEKSETQARSDPLTGLLNRRSLENHIADLQRTATPYMLAYADLDHFKVLNDTHGHEAGDQALRLFTRVMRESVRPDDVVCRYGGEEFVIVLPNCEAAGAVAVLERVRERLALALAGGRVPSFTVSFGVASSSQHDSFDQIVASADRALMGAKAAGRNRVIVAEQSGADVASVASA